MTIQSRATLKTNFGAGAIPTSTNFANLIDTAIDGEAITYTVRTVRSSGGDYTSIAAALAAITDASSYNRYRILVEPGSFVEDDLTLKDYIDIYGSGIDQTTLKSTGDGGSVILVPANCTVAGFSLIAINNSQYAVHLDNGAWQGTFTLKNCKLIHRQALNVLGCGGRAGQVVRIENCIINGSVGIHGDQGSGREPGKPWTYEFTGCTMTTLALNDFLEYEPATVKISGCWIDRITYAIDTSYYTGNPGDTDYNRGFQVQSINILDDGTNRIGRCDLTSSAVRSTPFVLPSITSYAVSSNAVAAGEAVKLDADPSYGGNAATEPNNDLPAWNVTVWNGSGIFVGVAVAAISAGAQGVIQHGGRPQVLADASGAAIAYGDALELNSSGRFVKRTTGTIVAYARAALASGTGLITVSGFVTAR